MNYTELKSIADLEKLYPKHILDKFPISGRSIWSEIPDEKWYDWKWQIQNRIEDLDTLESVITLTEEDRKAYKGSIEKFKMSITPYFASLMDPDDPNCPIRKQSVPDAGELTILPTDMKDPLAEDKYMPVPGLTHRYPDRVLFYTSYDCPMLCRHCTRKRKVANPDSAVASKQLEEGLEYIKNNKKIRDVIVSGGDPLCLSNERVDFILGELRKIEHVEVLRLGTRTPVTLPQRLYDNELLKIIEKHQPIHINTHFNHPKEMTREALFVSTKASMAGATLGNQTVLLKRVNDNPDIITKLCHKLLLLKIRPYYLFQCDPAEGTSHFRTPINTGVEIIEKMRGWTSGLAVPHFVVDSPGGGGKIPLGPNYFVKREGNKVTLRNYSKKEFEYFELEDEVYE